VRYNRLNNQAVCICRYL